MIILHSNDIEASDSLLSFATTDRVVCDHFPVWLGESDPNGNGGHPSLYLPRKLCPEALQSHGHVQYYDDSKVSIRPALVKGRSKRWFSVINGRFVTYIDHRTLNGLLDECSSDVLFIEADPSMVSYRERVRITSDNRVAGFRRHYCDSAHLSYMPDNWPHQVFIRSDVLGDLAFDGVIPLDFKKFVDLCEAKGLSVISLSVGGSVLDLNTIGGFLTFVLKKLNLSHVSNFDLEPVTGRENLRKRRIAKSVRIFGNVLIGDDVSIGENSIIVGPAILCDGVSIGRGSVIKRSIVASGVSLCRNGMVKDSVVIDTGGRSNSSVDACHGSDGFAGANKVLLYDSPASNSNFRLWPRISYFSCLKRITDILMSLSILILFAPFFPIIAIAIKLNSSGPVFYKARRQGFHGEEFNCLKFRSMSAEADEFQDKLRVINQVDGPQFKMEDDPRVTVVGKFLRDTFIDEIPQFLNVLRGQMSVVGPRPSPEDENLLCPQWRDARLSVRPGITGLWQVYRTRTEGMDFQEWIFYDTRYVRELSAGLDLLIIWKTAGKLVKNFFEKF